MIPGIRTGRGSGRQVICAPYLTLLTSLPGIHSQNAFTTAIDSFALFRGESTPALYTVAPEVDLFESWYVYLSTACTGSANLVVRNNFIYRMDHVHILCIYIKFRPVIDQTQCGEACLAFQSPQPELSGDIYEFPQGHAYNPTNKPF